MVAWKLLLASTAFASDQCEDQTALLQSHLASHKSALGSSQAETMLNFPKMTTLSDPTKRKMALAQFEQTAMELAKNKDGVTDVVVEVCQETAELLETTVLAAITNEHDTDQAMLNSAFAEFAPIEANRAIAEAAISAATGSVQGRIETHRVCRADENTRCISAGHCEAECERLTELEELTKVELEVIHQEILSTYCHVLDDGTLDYGQIGTGNFEQHETNRAQFQAYIDKLAELTALQAEMDLQCSACQAALSNHTESRTECNTVQRELEAAACSDLHVGSGALELYLTNFHIARSHYEQLRDSVMIMEADRKVEWDTLTRVICLLMTLTNPDDGAAASDETAAAIAACQPLDPITGVGSDVDTSHLDIQYHPLPDPLSLPELPVNPCSEDFVEMAYSGTPTCAPYDTDYDHGIVTECTCMATPPVIPESGFPHELGPFLLFDTGFHFVLDGDGFQLTNNGQDWSVQFEGGSYSGRLSMFASVTLPALDEAFGVSVAQVAWAYPDPQGTAEMITLHGEDYPETMQHRFIRTGGFVYLNDAGVPVALKEISPSASSLGQNAELTLHFGEHRIITEAQGLAACPRGYNTITLASLNEAGAEAYCWNFDATIDFCSHGCFLYRTTSGYIGFPVTEAPAEFYTPQFYVDNAEHNIPSTDQYGATQHVPAMLTGQTAQTAPDFIPAQ